jgi:hypothetical protein
VIKAHANQDIDDAMARGFVPVHLPMYLVHSMYGSIQYEGSVWRLQGMSP